MNIKLKAATQISKLAGKLAKQLGKGSGEQITGVIFNKLISNPIEQLTQNKEIFLVSATNGKTSTTNMLVKCVLANNKSVASNLSGANLQAGITSALINSPNADYGIFETDERVVTSMLKNTTVKAVILGNLSRDQLDRYGEVTAISTDWKKGLADSEDTVVVANSMDPNIVYSAIDSHNVVWVEPSQTWVQDANSCPKCSEKIIFSKAGFKCSNCDFGSPKPDVLVKNDEIIIDDKTYKMKMQLKGQWNLVNAAFVMALCNRLKNELNFDLDLCKKTIESIDNIQGRGTTVEVDDDSFELCLAKNPAGYSELIEYYKNTKPDNIIFAFNARVADGKDPSWLWDVEFENLPKTNLITCGERANDISTRLQYCNFSVTQVDTIEDAIRLCKNKKNTSVVASYTQFYKNSKDWKNLVKKSLSTNIKADSDKTIKPTTSENISTANTNSTKAAHDKSFSSSDSKLTIGLIFPDVLGTYGDRGNATVLQKRAQAYGIESEVIDIETGTAIPENIDIYCFGGGEDAAQSLASESMLKNAQLLKKRSEEGAIILAICAGFQLFGNTYIDANGKQCKGLGIFDADTVAGSNRQINELVVETNYLSNMFISGFENHGGITKLGSDCKPFGKVTFGFGNNGIVDGALVKNTIGTYAHGPVLPRNPKFADELIKLATNINVLEFQDNYNFAQLLHEDRIAESELSAQDRKKLLRQQNTTY